MVDTFICLQFLHLAFLEFIFPPLVSGDFSLRVPSGNAKNFLSSDGIFFLLIKRKKYNETIIIGESGIVIVCAGSRFHRPESRVTERF